MKLPEPSVDIPVPPETEEQGGARGVRAPTSSNLPQVVRPSPWRPPLELRAPKLEAAVNELQADLQLLVGDLRRGPLTRMIDGVQGYLGELRREFLRHHRRLVVHVRNEEGVDGLSEFLHAEVAELSDRFRGIALGRAARLSEFWSPQQLIEVLDRTIASLPETLICPLEPSTFEGHDDESLFAAGMRQRLRAAATLRRWVGVSEHRREVRLRRLADFHLAEAVSAKVEGMAALFVHVDVELSGRTRTIFEGIAQAYRDLAERPAEALPDLVGKLREQVEDEMQLAEQEIRRICGDVSVRATDLFSQAMRRIKDDLPRLGTFDLPTRKRHPRTRLKQRAKVLTTLEEQLATVRESGAADYALLAMQLEFVAFESRTRKALAGEVSSLSSDVRGRSFVQLERVQSSLNDALATIRDNEEITEEALHEAMDPVEKILGEAIRGLFQLMEQLEADTAAAPLLDALTRQAEGLTDRYSVPAARLAHAEWRLPQPHPIFEVPLREIVSAYVVTDVSPRVLDKTNEATPVVQPLLAFCQELERIVTLNTEAGFAEPSFDQEQGPLRDVVLAALDRRMETLREQVEHTEVWPEKLARDLRGVIFERLAILRLQLAEGRAAELRDDLLRRAQSAEILGRLDRVTTVVDRLGDDAASSIKSAIGEARLVRWKRSLGVGREDALEMDPAVFAPPELSIEIPIVYKRLFAAQAHWAGDALHQEAVRRARERLAHAKGVRALAVVGLDAASKVAMVSAIARGERFGAVKQISLKKPMSVADVEAMLAELPRGQLVVVSGLRWLMAARPGGLAPIRRFVEGVVADANRNAWLVESGHLVWQFACRVAPVDALVTEVVRADPLSLEDLERALLARHHLSGYELFFEDAGGHRSLLESTRSASQQSYFAALHRASGGVLHIALRFWLASLVSVSEADAKVVVGPVPDSPIPKLRRLDDETMTLLYQVARQGWMDGDTLGCLFRTDPTTARARLLQLANAGLLERTQKVFQIPLHLRSGVVQALIERGWVE